ncbi:hypothetical protein Dsin_004387 [Dipteronia sinensis]|uniref:Reverse transcriptase zinc-binding domain-containing protein n=1 Tax=Dipteronia sinensis TaxID=43782 RepID=A0AAE0EL93_9ROSI|nr:hypothetical protein Dsin_004387 [Dipteronia sinensis]
MLAKPHSGPAKVIWGWSNCGDFSVKSAYLGAIEAKRFPLWSWRFIWNLKFPPMVLYFLWTLVHEKILTNLQRVVRGTAADFSYPRCNSGIENVDHLLRGCRESIAIWEKFSKGSTSSVAFKGDLEGWLVGNLQSGKLTDDKLPSYLQFSNVLWFLWKGRCNKVCDLNFSTPQSPHLIINMFAKDWLDANFAATNRDIALLSVASLEPNENWVKLNIYGSRNSETGLKMARNSGFSEVIVEFDSLTTVHLIYTITRHNHPLFNLIQNCKKFVAADWCCNINHIYREGNKLVDGLARMGHSMDIGTDFFKDPPSVSMPILYADYRGLT